ncbi:unnamed protein product [marine sediment metagenome]|uniref:Uncharacterized protein n=1 Tax=marine sediment metagenome TaxID=412755 RepID=X0UR92_9ZZZZ
MKKQDFLRMRETAMAKHEGRMEIINKQIDKLKEQMKDTDKNLRRML